MTPIDLNTYARRMSTRELIFLDFVLVAPVNRFHTIFRRRRKCARFVRRNSDGRFKMADFVRGASPYEEGGLAAALVGKWVAVQF